MTISSNYKEHVEISKQLKMSNGFYEVREPYKEDFEKIYNEAKEQKIELSSAKMFLNSLSKEELSTVQNYARMWDTIDVSKLDDEGAYNLLLHHYEKFDFDNNGVVSDGLAMTETLLPVNMSSDEKEVLVQTLNEMPEFESFMALAMIRIPKLIVVDVENDGSIKFRSNERIRMTYDIIKDRVDNILNPPPGAYSSPELKDTMTNFLKFFEKNFENKMEQKEHLKHNNTIKTEAIKVKLEHQNNLNV